MSIDFESLKDKAVVLAQSGVTKAKELTETGVAKAKELAGSETDPLKLVENVYSFVVNNVTYDASWRPRSRADTCRCWTACWRPRRASALTMPA